MNKIKLAVAILILNYSFLHAGGLLTHTNQNVHFLRNPARDASTDIDGVYTNPAGLIFLSKGFHFSFNNQSAFQTRIITSTSDFFEMSGGGDTKNFKGRATAISMPSIQAAYRTGKWALSGSVAIAGGGGKATFKKGLPSFEAAAGAIVSKMSDLTKNGYRADQYSLNQYMKGNNYIFGVQVGATYKFNENFSFYAGSRFNIVYNKYKGYLRDLKMNLTPYYLPEYSQDMVSAQLILESLASNEALPLELRQPIKIMAKASSDAGVKLESSQDGWGIAPILGINYNYDNRLNIGFRYEFNSSLDVTNHTKMDDTGLFADGVNSAHDLPSLLALGVSYRFAPKIIVSTGYHHFFDSNAKMAEDKHKDAGATNEYLAGIEYELNNLITLSTGMQITRYGVGNIYQKDLSFVCNSFSLGVGGAINITPTMQLNLGYFRSNYSDYTKIPGGGTSRDVFSRKSQVIGIGVDYSF